MNYADIFLIAIMAVGFVLGLVKGWRRVVIGALVFGVAFYALTMEGGVLNYISNFIRYNSINFLVDKGFIKPIVIDLTESIGVAFRVETVEELFLILQNFDIAADVIKVNCDIFCKMVGLIALLPVVILGCWIISSIAYFLILKWIMPKFLRKGFIPRAIGGVFNCFFWGAIGIMSLSLIYSPIAGVTNNIIPELSNTESEIYKLLAQAIGDMTTVDKVVSIFNLYVDKFDPISTGSSICRPFINILNSIGLNPFNIISSEVSGETVSFAESFDSFLKNIVDSIKKFSSTGKVTI